MLRGGGVRKKTSQNYCPRKVQYLDSIVQGGKKQRRKGVPPPFMKADGNGKLSVGNRRYTGMAERESCESGLSYLGDAKGKRGKN